MTVTKSKSVGYKGFRDKIRERVRGEWLYLVSLILYLSVAFFETAMFERPFLFKLIKYLPLVILPVKLLLFDDNTGALIFLKAAVVLSAVITVSIVHTESSMLLMAALFLVSAGDVPFKSILKVFIIVNLAGMAVTLLACGMGLIENLKYPATMFGAGHISYAFGFKYTTDAVAHLFFLILAVYYLYRERLNHCVYLVLILLQIPVYIFTTARCGCICIILLSIVYLIFLFRKKNGKGEGKLEKCLKKCLVYSMPFMALLSFGLVLLYMRSPEIFLKADILLSGRLKFAGAGLAKYGLSVFGRNIEFTGWGGAPRDAVGENYDFIDNSYLFCGIKFGVIWLLILISSYVAACKKYSSDIYFLISVFFTALSSVFEHHLPDMGYAIFFLSVFALKEKQGAKDAAVKKKGAGK